MPISYLTDEGVTVTFESEEARESAEEWYNADGNSKGVIIRYCKSHGLDLLDPKTKTLLAGWSDLAMECWAKNQA